MFPFRRTALASTVACAVLSSSAGGFRWKLEGVNDVTRPDVAESANLGAVAHVSGDRYIAVTDWRCVMWELELPHDPETGRILSCGLKRLCKPELTVDVEGLALDPLDGSVWIADEKAATIRRHSPVTGKAIGGNVEIPALLKNFVIHYGFESLTISKDGLSMWTCTEEALKSDGPRSSRRTGTDVRLVRFRRKSAKAPWKPSGQWVYRTDPLAGGPWYSSKKKNLACSGVSELCVLDDGTLLVLEREFSRVIIPRLRCRIYETDMSSAENVEGMKDLSALKEGGRVKKKLLYETTGFSMYEGMCQGPVLKDGSRMLVLVSDADKGSFRSVLPLRLSRVKSGR